MADHVVTGSWRWRGPRKLAVAVTVIALFAAACGGPGAPQETAATGTAASDELEPIPFTLAEGAAGWSFVWILTVIADAEGFFEEAGLQFERVLTPGSPIQALVSGAVQAVNSAPGHLVNARAEDASVVGVFPLLQTSTPSLIVRRDLLEQAGLSGDEPLAEKAQLLRGLKIGLNSLTGGEATLTRFALDAAGLDASRDAQLLALGGTQEIEAAWTRGEIDVFASSPPSAERAIVAGEGAYLVRGARGEVPGFANYPHQLMMVDRRYAEENPEAVTRAVHGYLLAARALAEDPEAMKQVVRDAAFPDLDDEVFELSWEHIIPAITTPDDAEFTAAMFDDIVLTSNVSRRQGDLPEVEGVAFEDILTNEFVEAARDRLAD